MTSIDFNWAPTQTEWEAGIAQFPEANFLQSFNWGVFNERMGKTVLRLQAISKNVVIAQVSMIIETAKRGTYMAIAGGPLVDWKSSSLVERLFAEILKAATEQGCSFVRFRPQVIGEKVSPKLLTSIRALVAPMHVTADLTLQLDLTLSDEELLAAMRKNTRSSIRKSEKLGITTTISTDPTDIRAFYEEEKKVAERQGFIPFSYEFLETQFEVFVGSDQVALVHSYSDEHELLASAFIIFYNGEAVYHYGVSTEENAKLPGSYACQWRAIAEAKARGCSRYNFWGIAPKEETEHRFAGVSLFKRGFGGGEVPYLVAQDIPLSWKYWVTYLFELLRKKYRRL